MSELRQNLVSGDWIIMAPERGRRPHDFLPKRKRRVPSPKATCPMENLAASGNLPILASYPNDARWEVVAIRNKYPALRHIDACAVPLKRGPYTALGGVGAHEMIVTRDHTKNFAHLSPRQAVQVLLILQERYRAFQEDPCLRYASTFFNWGETAGASLFHPHYQLLGLPIIPPNIASSIEGSRRYFKKHRRCVHCEMIAYEERVRKRVIAKNAGAIAVTPYVSRNPFGIRIFPRRHHSCFERTPLADLRAVSAALQSCLRLTERHLNDPDFNFFIHTAPLTRQTYYRHYHWHIGVIPKVTIPAGFELSTGIDINTVDPDLAAHILRGERRRQR